MYRLLRHQRKQKKKSQERIEAQKETHKEIAELVSGQGKTFSLKSIENSQQLEMMNEEELISESEEEEEPLLIDRTWSEDKEEDEEEEEMEDEEERKEEVEEVGEDEDELEWESNDDTEEENKEESNYMYITPVHLFRVYSKHTLVYSLCSFLYILVYSCTCMFILVYSCSTYFHIFLYICIYSFLYTPCIIVHIFCIFLFISLFPGNPLLVHLEEESNRRSRLVKQWFNNPAFSGLNIEEDEEEEMERALKKYRQIKNTKEDGKADTNIKRY